MDPYVNFRFIKRIRKNYDNALLSDCSNLPPINFSLTLDLERICIVKNEEYFSIRLLENHFLLVSPSDLGCILTLLNAIKC